MLYVWGGPTSGLTLVDDNIGIDEDAIFSFWPGTIFIHGCYEIDSMPVYEMEPYYCVIHTDPYEIP